jgi:outer membrane protein, multidrug efflux system
VVRRRKIEPMRAMQAKPLGAKGIALLLSACTTVGPDFKRTEVPWLDAWSGGSLESLSSKQGGKRRGRIEEWWRNFNDPVLDRLITEALRLNPNVRTAGARILEARAQLGIAGSTLYPRYSR